MIEIKQIKEEGFSCNEEISLDGDYLFVGENYESGGAYLDDFARKDIQKLIDALQYYHNARED